MHLMPHTGGPNMLMATLLLLGAALLILMRTGRLGPVRFAPGGRRGAGPGSRPTAEDEALTRLAQRLAEGDITPEEYLERSSVLRGSATPPPPGSAGVV